MPLPPGLYDSQRYTRYGSPDLYPVSSFPTPADVLLTGWAREVQPHSVKDVPRPSPTTPESNVNSNQRCPSPRKETQQPQHARPVKRSRKGDTAIMVTLSTGETMKAQQVSNRVKFDNFPAITDPLPADIQDEEVITDWPNHLWGPLLLRIAAKYSPKEIIDLLKIKMQPNTMIKRIIAAKKHAGIEVKKGAKDPQKGGTKRKRASKKTKENKKAKHDGKEEDQNAEQPIEEEHVELGPESEAARAFRIQQEELQIAFLDQNADFVNAQFGKKRRKGRLERELVEAACREVEQRKSREVELD